MRTPFCQQARNGTLSTGCVASVLFPSVGMHLWRRMARAIAKTATQSCLVKSPPVQQHHRFLCVSHLNKNDNKEKRKFGAGGYRSRYLVNANHALYHLSYSPSHIKFLLRNSSHSLNICHLLNSTFKHNSVTVD